MPQCQLATLAVLLLPAGLGAAKWTFQTECSVEEKRDNLKFTAEPAGQ